MMPTRSERNWGGRRPGAGRKPETLSVRQLAKMEKAADARAKKEGRTVYDVILDIAYQGSEGNRLAASKLWLQYTVPQVHEGGEADKALGPAVFLPEKHPRLELVEGGKKDKDEGYQFHHWSPS